MKILYGPPGTGKTRQAARDAVKILKPDAPEEQIPTVHRQLVEAGRIVWVTFHPSYSYEDFVEGLRPTVVEQGITYRARPGPFRLACEQVGKHAPAFIVGQRIESTSGQEYEVLHVGSDSVVLEKTKGKGKGLITPVSLLLVDRLRELGYDPGDLSIQGADHDEKKKISEDVGWDMQTLFSMTGPLRAVWEYVVDSPAGDTSPVVLVVDEVNRADLSRVFGELITLLETDKRLGGTDERTVYLPYSGDLFGVPAELSVIGTMNTSDRSLALMDLALRRRFAFEEVLPDPGLCASPYGGLDLPEILGRWNHRITGLLTREHRIGHSYLMRPQLERIREANGFVDDEEGKLKALGVTIRENILPLLQEYFHDDWRKIDLVFGRDFSHNEGGLLEEIGFHELDAHAAEIVDLADTTDYRAGGFWNPDSPDWDPDEFRTAVDR